MRIIETNIPDVNPDNIDYSKVDLANRIIQNISPLFDELYNDKVSQVRELTEQLNHKRKKVIHDKEELEILLRTYKKKQKIHKLLERIEKLVSTGLVNEVQTKQDAIILLKVIDKLPDDKLDYHLRNTMSIITKRFSQT